jgi:hypothetical protein
MTTKFALTWSVVLDRADDGWLACIVPTAASARDAHHETTARSVNPSVAERHRELTYVLREQLSSAVVAQLRRNEWSILAAEANDTVLVLNEEIANRIEIVVGPTEVVLKAVHDSATDVTAVGLSSRGLWAVQNARNNFQTNNTRLTRLWDLSA